jgi:hypothetical protein
VLRFSCAASTNTSVCSKGALIGVCLDIIIRKKAMEKEEFLMQKLSNEYGVSKPFNDALFAK